MTIVTYETTINFDRRKTWRHGYDVISRFLRLISNLFYGFMALLHDRDVFIPDRMHFRRQTFLKAPAGKNAENNSHHKGFPIRNKHAEKHV